MRSVTDERQQRAHERHRLAPRPPAADADGHAVVHLGDDVVDRDALVGNGTRYSILTGSAGADRRRGGVRPVQRRRQIVRLRPRDRMPGRWTTFASTARSCSSPAGAAASAAGSRSASPRPARTSLICCRHEPEILPDGVAVRRGRRARARPDRRGDRATRRAVRPRSTCSSTTRAVRRPPTPRPRRRGSRPGSSR